MENERYLESKMVTNGFGSYLELTTKAYEFISKPDSAAIKIYETSEMKEANEPIAKSNLLSTGLKIVNQTHNQ